jgi:hypothetical protein
MSEMRDQCKEDRCSSFGFFFFLFFLGSYNEQMNGKRSKVLTPWYWKMYN